MYMCGAVRRGALPCVRTPLSCLRNARRGVAASVPPQQRQETQHEDGARHEQSRQYRRKSSNPVTLRERGDFQRDNTYSKRRPLPDVPWRQHKECSYMDEAERLYGRKDTWHAVSDTALRERLMALLRDYARDLVSAIRLEVRDACRYRGMCNAAAREYRTHVVAAARGDAPALRRYAAQVLMHTRHDGAGEDKDSGDDSAHAATGAVATDAVGGEDARHVAVAECDAAAHDDAGVDNKTTDDDAADDKHGGDAARRLRGQRALLDDTVAVADLPDADVRRAPQSAFPFLRQRALQHASTLDPSLVDWTARYYPDDDASMFAAPPQLRQPAAASPPSSLPDAQATSDAMGVDGDKDDVGKDKSKSAATPPRTPRLHARQRLRRTLRDHDDRHRATFDADGVFYHVRPPRTVTTRAAAAAAAAPGDGDGSALGVEDVPRAPTPREVRGRDITAGTATRVVKVPWAVASLARRQGYSADILRAKERLVRLSRGEDPATIP